MLNGFTGIGDLEQYFGDWSYRTIRLCVAIRL